MEKREVSKNRIKNIYIFDLKSNSVINQCH